MLTDKEKIDQFKRELKSMQYYSAKMAEIQDELIRLDRIMHEAKPQRYSQSKGNPINYLDLMEEESQLKCEYDFLTACKRKVDASLELLADEERCMLIDLYIKGDSFEKLSMQKYMSVRNLKYKIDQIIKGIV